MFSSVLKAKDQTRLPDDIPGVIVKNQCSTCRWFRPESGVTCDSFPKGIPDPILLGAFDHRVPFNPQDEQELLYSPISV